MMNIPIQRFSTRGYTNRGNSYTVRTGRPCAVLFRRLPLLFCLALLLFFGSLVADCSQPDAYASATPGPGQTCQWYTVRHGDTLTGIAASMGTHIQTLARANHLKNINHIYKKQVLCIPCSIKQGNVSSGLMSNGTVRWYAYSALQSATHGQVMTTLLQAAVAYHLPASLVQAIAWQESGWQQRIISHDGGIGVMQIMPYTAMGLNTSLGVHYDPYKLRDNIYLGAYYLHILWNNFHGDLNKVISAYNEGGWAVVHRGIFNWRYVKNVRSLMCSFE
jgi:LysM repeat protein